ncbi:hypothetical protein HPB50_002257 [Hyalomma asiaticum]|uniref:Uncharacterized protein n=1 Tax=Hyalomma asiaticum TaxID=266040 RepID=A0ACB7TBI8_HYAAI|nr:hypothetical protein HPB50_002257 [Hyalomma asiaticum]
MEPLTRHDTSQRPVTNVTTRQLARALSFHCALCSSDAGVEEDETQASLQVVSPSWATAAALPQRSRVWPAVRAHERSGMRTRGALAACGAASVA